MSATRRLAAILAVDVAGYSRLMGQDESGTARAVREHREAARPIVASLGGRIVKTMGDGVLLEFPSVVAAVECAIAIQKLMVERNAGVPENKRILYRIGVNLGDVLIEGRCDSPTTASLSGVNRSWLCSPTRRQTHARSDRGWLVTQLERG
jgi:class 3 adenylate cyclase